MKQTNQRPTSLAGLAFYLMRLYTNKRPWVIAAIVAVVAALSLGSAWVLTCNASSSCPSAAQAPAAESPCSR